MAQDNIEGREIKPLRVRWFRNSLKEIIINIELNEDLEPIIDKMIVKFPHLAQEIFKELDYKSIANCQKVSKIWFGFIDNQKFQCIRKMQEYKESMKYYNGQWNKVMKKTPVQNIKELFVAVELFFEVDPSRMRKQWSPLHIASEYGNLHLYMYIIEKIGNDNANDHTDASPYHLAAKNGHLAICSYIIETAEDKNPAAHDNGCTPLHHSAENGHWKICKLIVEKVENKSPTAFNGTPLRLAAKEGHFKACKILAANGADKKPLFDGKTPFQMALEERQLILCSILMSGSDQHVTFIWFLLCYGFKFLSPDGGP